MRNVLYYLLKGEPGKPKIIHGTAVSSLLLGFALLVYIISEGFSFDDSTMILNVSTSTLRETHKHWHTNARTHTHTHTHTHTNCSMNYVMFVMELPL